MPSLGIGQTMRWQVSPHRAIDDALGKRRRQASADPLGPGCLDPIGGGATGLPGKRSLADRFHAGLGGGCEDALSWQQRQ